jgi:hypothetical protein
MMNHVVLQFTRLENLLAEAAGADAVRVHVMAQTETAASAVLTRKEIEIGLCVRTIVPGYKILSWYCPVDKFSFYLPERPANGSGRSPEQARYETAWQQATTMQDELVALLRRDEQSVCTDGVIELNVPNMLRGTTNLIALPAAYEEAAEGT